MSQETDYKQLDVQMRNLIQELRTGENSLYSLGTMCVRAWKDIGDFARQLQITPHQADAKLRSYLAEFGVDIEEMCAILTVFPNREQWERKSLLTIRDDAVRVAQEAEVKRRRECPPPARRTATIAQLDAVKTELKAKELVIAELSQPKPQVVQVATREPASVPMATVAHFKPEQSSEVVFLRAENKRLAEELKRVRKLAKKWMRIAKRRSMAEM